MCGIAGFLRFQKQRFDLEQRQRILNDMGSAIARRGPDEQTFYDDGTLSFVFRRLSIIDVDGGQQPIWNEDRSIFVAVNGEIYNHRELREPLEASHTFRTQSDSEVVLHLYEEYGETCFERLNGMFAVVLWDVKQQKLLLARDPMGIKPLYYVLIEEGLIFGSELKALLMHPECPRDLAWNDLDIIGVQQKSQVSTYVEGVHFLGAGCYATMSAGRSFTQKHFWRIDDHIRHEAQSVGTARYRDDYARLVEDAVKKQLMSDVPVGLFLSGGIDSSLIAAIAAAETQDLHCFTVVERTTVLAGDVRQAFEVCDQLGLPLYAALFDVEALAEQFTFEDFERQIAMIESPRFDPEWYFKNELHKFAKREVPDVKVMLLGQGADEFAGGYSRRQDVDYGSWDEYLASEIDTDLSFYSAQGHGVPPRFDPLLRSEYRYRLGNFRPHDYHSKMRLLTYQLQHFNLWHEDRSSSYEGVESRVPFLDHRIVELAASIPDRDHEQLFWDKSIVRSTLKKWLPNYPEDKEKVAFFVTDRVSVINDFAVTIARRLFPQFARDFLQRDDCPFDAAEVEKIHRHILERNASLHYNAWFLLEIMSVCVFERLCREPERMLDIVARPSKTAIRCIGRGEFDEIEHRFLSEPAEPVGRTWRPDNCIRIARDCRILMSLDAGDNPVSLVLMHDGKIANGIDVPPDHDWLLAFFERLTELGEDYKDLRYWSEATSLDMQLLVNTFDQLVNIGYLEQVPGTTQKVEPFESNKSMNAI